jgi:hypothetical protein
VLHQYRRPNQWTLPAQQTRSRAARAAPHIQDTIAGLELKIISRESAEALPHLTYQVFASRWAYVRSKLARHAVGRGLSGLMRLSHDCRSLHGTRQRSFHSDAGMGSFCAGQLAKLE